MSTRGGRIELDDPQIRQALADLRDLISERYPAATFNVERGEDPEGIYLVATVDVEDTDEVAALYTERLLDLQVEGELPVHVLPIRPLDRVIREIREQRALPVALLPV